MKKGHLAIDGGVLFLHGVLGKNTQDPTIFAINFCHLV
ncbi:hypothetical protein L248_0086 [Schleiferilactobacillus shenzhenensis LY-73]|uniref:Uncharacterized protein n=1 Tax=Schleiferilactobacillus shenzhenensis LY-73 TaxID=1231336 RepID=U4TYM3_9LACO|nr:hypothetical protein L248_0086 [Schleiferilactobacillus shenzhenensis LY-73]